MLQCLFFHHWKSQRRFINLFNHLYQGLTFTEGSLMKSDLIKKLQKENIPFLFHFVIRI